MKNRYIIGAIVLLLFVSILPANAAQRAEQMISIGGGYYAGMTGAACDITFKLPKLIFSSDDLYLRIGIAVTDSTNLTPLKDWRRFAPLYIDGILYIYGNTYIGGGLNFPLMVSDNEKGNLGGEAYFGSEFYVYQRSKVFAEIGYGIVRRLEYERFEGLHFIIGWRYDWVTAKEEEKTDKMEKPQAQAAEVTKPALDVVREPPASSNAAENEALQSELARIREYIDDLDNRINKARRAGNIKKVAELKTLKQDAMERARIVKGKIDRINGYSLY